jgi:hypothetical protein
MGDGGSSSDGDLAVLAGQLNVVNARLVAATEVLLETGEWQQGGMRSPKAFLAWRLGLSPERAEQIVTIAQRRSEFPTVIGLFDQGLLSVEQVNEAVQVPAWADPDIAHFATIATVSKLRRAKRSQNFTGDPDEPDPVATPVDRLHAAPISSATAMMKSHASPSRTAPTPKIRARKRSTTRTVMLGQYLAPSIRTPDRAVRRPSPRRAHDTETDRGVHQGANRRAPPLERPHRARPQRLDGAGGRSLPIRPRSVRVVEVIEATPRRVGGGSSFVGTCIICVGLCSVCVPGRRSPGR